MEVQPNAKVTVHKVPPAAPGKCVVCGFSGDVEESRTFIDFGFDIDYYGVVYFCSDCIVEIVNAIGFVSEDQYQRIANENADLIERMAVLVRERDSATNALRTYLNGHPGIGSASESEELATPVQPIKRDNPKQPRPKSKTISDAKESRSNDSSDNDGDTISID